MKLPRSILAGISAPALPIAGLGLPIVVYLPNFFANSVGIPLAMVGVIFMLARFWDVFTDVVFGVVADRTRPPLGRRKFWLLLSVPVLMVSVWQIFNPPAGVGVFWLSMWLGILYVGWTMATISAVSWSAELSTDYDERTRVQAWYMGFLMIGLIAVLIIPAAIEQLGGGDDRAKMQGIALFIIILLPLCFGFALWKVPEPAVHEDTSEDWSKVLKSMWRSKPLLLILACDLMIGLASGIAGSLYLFVAVDALGLGKGASLLLLFYFLIGCFAVPLWAWAAKRLEKHRALAGASIYAGLTALLFLLVPAGSMIFMLIVTVLNGITYASARFLLKAMMADVTDADRMQSGRMQSGVYFSLLTLTEKIGLALAVGVPFVILPALGFEPRGEKTAEGIRALVMIFALAPASLHLAAAFVLWRFPLGRAHQRELREKLATRFGDFRACRACFASKAPFRAAQRQKPRHLPWPPACSIHEQSRSRIECGSSAVSEPKAFSGLRVVDLTQGIAGPHCTMLLAQHGADVIKIEPMEGDWGRTLGDLRGDHGGHSISFNRGKRSIVLNLKHPDGIAIVRKLVADANVFGESFRPGVIKRLGLGYDALKAMNEKLVYFSVSGYGQEGPLATRPTVDTLIQAFSGMMVMNRTPEGVPHRQGMIAVDVLTGLYGFQAVSAALTKQLRFGIGTYIDNSMMLATAAFQGAKLMEHAISEGNPPPLYVPAGMFKTTNGYLVVSSMRKHHFTKLMEIIGRPDIPADPRMQTHESRIRNAPIINKALAESFPAKSTEEWLEQLLDAGIFAERVNNYQDYLDHPHTKAVNAVDWIEQDGVGRVPVARIPGLPRPVEDLAAQHSPHIGEHGRAILGEIGYSSGDVDRLIKEGAVGPAPAAAKAAE